MTNHTHILGKSTGHEGLINFLFVETPAQYQTPNHAPSALTSALPADLLWCPHDEHDVTHVTEDGDLILDIRDLFTPNGFWNGDIICIWAEVNSFDLHGWNDAEAFWRMFEYTLFPAIAELENGQQLLDAVTEVMAGAPVPALPEFRIIVNGRALMEYLLLAFEGPFGSDEQARLAFEHRSQGYRSSLKGPPSEPAETW